jgi:hypothetical protein
MSGRRKGQWWISGYGQIPDTTPRLEHRSWHQSLQIHRVMIICVGLVNGRRSASEWLLVYSDSGPLAELNHHHLLPNSSLLA